MVLPSVTFRLRRADDNGTTPVTSLKTAAGGGGKRTLPPWQLGNEVLSNLPLQMALYFHLCYFPVWLVTQCALHELPVLGGKARLALYLILFLVEPLRLYLGYSGNLLERVSTLFAFWVLTLLFELPILGYLLLSRTAVVELAVNLPLLALLLGREGRGKALVARPLTRVRGSRDVLGVCGSHPHQQTAERKLPPRPCHGRPGRRRRPPRHEPPLTLRSFVRALPCLPCRIYFARAGRL